MGFLLNLFGPNKRDQALREAFVHIRRLIDDEKFQLELIHPAMRALLETAPACDKDPNGTGPFGHAVTNPIPTNGPIGQLAYLSKLETCTGQRVLFHRLGAIDKVDVFEAVTFDGSEWFILYVDLYHPRRSRLAPDGFSLTKDVAQFSGFTNFCPNFPYDFIDMKSGMRESGLSMAYIAISRISKQISHRVFQRPPAHMARLERLTSCLTSFQAQAAECRSN